MKKIKYLILGCIMTMCMFGCVACGRDDGSETESTSSTERVTTTDKEKETTSRSHMDEDKSSSGMLDDLVTDAESMVDDMVTAAKDIFE